MNPQATIFVCDDEEDVRGSLSFLLRHAEFDVRAFGSGAALLATIDSEPQPLRAVFVLDLDMPPMDGDLVHDQLIARGYAKRSPVIFLSGRGTIPRAVQAVNKGALDFVEKPHTSGTLLPLLHRAVALEAEWHHQAKRCSFLKEMWECLTPQQAKVAVLVAEGHLNKVSASMLQLSERMVEVHRAKAFEKLGVDSPAELATTIAALKRCGIVVGS
jgi:two-component system, LuxR family, response regulator DctR